MKSNTKLIVASTVLIVIIFVGGPTLISNFVSINKNISFLAQVISSLVSNDKKEIAAPNANKFSAMGVVLSIENHSSDAQITISNTQASDTSKTTFSFDLTNLKKIEDANYSPISLTDINTGDTVIIQGHGEGSSIVISRIVLLATAQKTIPVQPETQNGLATGTATIIDQLATSTTQDTSSASSTISTSTPDNSTTTESVISTASSTNTNTTPIQSGIPPAETPSTLPASETPPTPPAETTPAPAPDIAPIN